MRTQNFIKLSAAVRELSTVNWIFLDNSNLEYLWNGSNDRQPENGVRNYDLFHVRWKLSGELWSTNEKM